MKNNTDNKNQCQVNVEEFEDLAKVSDKDKVWDKHRSVASEVDQIYSTAEEPWLKKYSTRVNQCSPRLNFHFDENNKLKLDNAYFCKVRNCPVCQWRRSLRWKARMFQSLPKIKQQYPAGRWLFLTLTIKNCKIEDLREEIKTINNAWHKMIRRKIITDKVLGFVKSVEVTRGQDGSAHPHMHALLFVKSTYFNSNYYLTQEAWTELWQSCLKVNYKPVVNIKAVKAGKNIDKAVAETLKYSVKETDMTADPEWFIEFTKQTFKTRAISSGGVLKEIITEVSTEEMINTENEEKELIDEDTGEILEQKKFNAYWFQNSLKYRGKTS